jgi:hypothetical protein
MSDRRWWPLPISAPTGDVAQAINPMSWLFRTSAQTGLVNITTGRSEDPVLEHRIVAEVASYGRQLGRVIDALCVVVAQMPQTDLTRQQRALLAEFTKLAEEIAAVKIATRAARVSEPEIDRLIGEIEALRESDPTLHRRLTARLQAAFPLSARPRPRGQRVSAG